MYAYWPTHYFLIMAWVKFEYLAGYQHVKPIVHVNVYKYRRKNLYFGHKVSTACSSVLGQKHRSLSCNFSFLPQWLARKVRWVCLIRLSCATAALMIVKPHIIKCWYVGQSFYVSSIHVFVHLKCNCFNSLDCFDRKFVKYKLYFQF